MLTAAHPPQILTSVAAGTNACAAASVTEITYTVTGLDTPMIPYVSASGLTTNLGIANAVITAANTLKVRFSNPTAGSINTAGTLNIIAF